MAYITSACMVLPYVCYSQRIDNESEDEMNKITKAWTYGVAYLSLAVGSGVSISGNIADTYRVAGAIDRIPDGLDIAISAFWPAAVLLAIEMFVSRLWPATRPMQTVRWLGSIGIGFVAMYVSWHHLADLLSSRGQDGVVSTIGPLAIDGLAIMATGLILSSRGHKIVDTPVTVMTTTPAPADIPVMSEADIDRAIADMDIYGRLTADMATDTPSVRPVPVTPGPVSAVRPVSPAGPRADASGVPALLAAWMDTPEDVRPRAADVKQLLAAWTGRSVRQVSRYMASALAS